MVGARLVGENPEGARKRLNTDVEGGEVRAEFKTNGRGKGRLAEDQAQAVIVKPLPVLTGKAANESEVRLEVLAHVTKAADVFRGDLRGHSGIRGQPRDDVAYRETVPGAAASLVLQQVGQRATPDHDAAEVAVLALKAHVSDNAKECGLFRSARQDRQALAQPAGTVPQVVDVAVAAGLEVDDELEAVVLADALDKPEGLEASQATAVDAYGNRVVGD